MSFLHLQDFEQIDTRNMMELDGIQGSLPDPKSSDPKPHLIQKMELHVQSGSQIRAPATRWNVSCLPGVHAVFGVTGQVTWLESVRWTKG